LWFGNEGRGLEMKYSLAIRHIDQKSKKTSNGKPKPYIKFFKKLVFLQYLFLLGRLMMLSIL